MEYCTNSVVFPFCLIVNHLNYIIIAFIHDVYHATDVAIIYGVVISALFGVLMQMSYWFDKCKFKEITDIELQNFNRQPFNPDDYNIHNITRYTLIDPLVFKIIGGFFLVGSLLLTFCCITFSQQTILTMPQPFDHPLPNHSIVLRCDCCPLLLAKPQQISNWNSNTSRV